MTLRVLLRFSRDRAIPVGTLSENGRDTAFEYDPSFLATGLNPAPLRLPVGRGVTVFDQSGGMDTFGMFEDSMPDGWGRRLVDTAFRKKHGRLPTVLERLTCVGLNGMGALAYESVDGSAPVPPIVDGDWPISENIDLSKIAADAMDFDAGLIEDVLPEVRRAGGSSGGARPKAFIGFNPESGEVCAERERLPSGFEHWIVKFNTRRDGDSAGETEYRYHLMAVASGVDMSLCRLIETRAGKFFATRRFDRTADGGRLHFASAAGLLHANFRVPGDEYAMLFRLTDALTRDYSARKELFRRVTLNVLAHNRDDHLKNFGFLMDDMGCWRLAPFYDFTYSEGPNGWQTLSVAGEGENPGEDDLLRLAKDVSVDKRDAMAIIAKVRHVQAMKL